MNLEKELNTAAYTLTILVECIYIYVTNNNLNNTIKNDLVKLGRKLLFIIALYFAIIAFIGLHKNKSKSQYEQALASILVLSAAFIRLNIKSDDISFR